MPSPLRGIGLNVFEKKTYTSSINVNFLFLPERLDYAQTWTDPCYHSFHAECIKKSLEVMNSAHYADDLLFQLKFKRIDCYCSCLIENKL